MKIGIMGGTFNPVHNGHLALAVKAKETAGLDEIWFMPSGLPAHKSNSELLSTIDRFSMVKHAIEAKELLLQEGINPTIVNARFLKPIDEKLLENLFDNHKKVVTIEDNVITGGLSTNINKFIIDNKYNIDITNIALPEEFIPHGNSDEIYESVGLSPSKIADKIKSL